MRSLRLRLDIGPDPPWRDSKRPSPPPFAAAARDVADGTGSRIDDGDKNSPVELDVNYDDRTTFSQVIRDGVETTCLGGRLLNFLEFNSHGNSERSGLYALVYSDEDATLLQPYWSSRWSSDDAFRDGGTTNESTNRFLLLEVRVSFGGGSADEGVIEPNALVSSFVQNHLPNVTGNAECHQEKKRKLSSCRNHCIDLKLTTKLLHGDVRGSCWKKTNKVNILLCEEHWRERGKILQWILCTPKASSTTNENFVSTNQSSNGIATQRSSVQQYPALKSFVIHKFLGKDRFLIALACLIPTSLVFRGLDTFDGIQLSVDKPSFCQVRSLNLERPAVLRQYFGLDLDDAATPDRPTLEREDVVWRSCYGVGSGTGSVGIHPKYSATRQMTPAMKIIAEAIYEYLKRRFSKDNSVALHPFNHVTALLYYQKVDETEDEKRFQSMLGYHTDNVYSYDGQFIRKANSQMENTFTRVPENNFRMRIVQDFVISICPSLHNGSALLTLGDARELYFRRQESANEGSRKWKSDADTLPFRVEHGSLFLLHPSDEKPTRTSANSPIHRYQHGHVKFPHSHKLSAALAFRTVTSNEQVYKCTGKLYTQQPTVPQMLPLQPNSNCHVSPGSIESGSAAKPELDFLVRKFRRENFMIADKRLKALWLSVCYRYFKYKIKKRTM